jgi:hypothetical protein
MYYVHYVCRITSKEIGKVELTKVARVEICDIVTEGNNTIVNSSIPDGLIVWTKGSRVLPAGQYGSNYYRNSCRQRIVKHIYQIDGELLDKDEAIESVRQALECSPIEAGEYVATLPRLTM